MFSNKFKICRHTLLVDGNKTRDFLEIEVYSPNGENRIDSFDVDVSSVKSLIIELEKYK